MTKDEAKSRIRTLLEIGGSDGFNYKEREALDMAIEALEKLKSMDFEVEEGYDDTFDVIIHCINKKDHDECINKIISLGLGRKMDGGTQCQKKD